MSKKYVLCRPQGGINDSLIQIEHCWRYADLTGRTLIVDTESRGGFGLPFGTFFMERSPYSLAILSPDTQLKDDLELCSVTPSGLTGRIHTYTAKYSTDIRNFVDSKSGIQLTFNFREDPKTDLVLHEQCWGPEEFLSLQCLERLRMTAEFRTAVMHNLNQFGSEPYRAVIVRNSTDYQTDYRAFFQKIKSEVLGTRLLVVSDDSDVKSYAKSFFCDSEIFFTEKPAHLTQRKPYAQLMLELDESSRFQLVVSAFADLFGAALAQSLYASKLVSGGPGGFSGFVLLAMHLCQNKKIARDLLS